MIQNKYYKEEIYLICQIIIIKSLFYISIDMIQFVVLNYFFFSLVPNVYYKSKNSYKNIGFI